MNFIDDFVQAIRAAGYAVRETTMPAAVRMFVVIEEDGTRTEVPMVDIFEPKDYVEFYRRARGTTQDERLRNAGL